MNILSPSMLSANFAILGEQLNQIKEGGAKYLHVDVMDGVFVPRISFGMYVTRSIRKATDLVFDVHLMITEPIRHIDDFANTGADIITVHLEACSDVAATLQKIHDSGCKAGLSIKPGTDIEELRPYLPMIDNILIMSVEPGFGGQVYMEEATDRIRRARQMITESGYNIDLEVDGGIKLSNVSVVLEAGANVIVAGSAVFKQGNVKENTKDFMNILNKYED